MFELRDKTTWKAQAEAHVARIDALIGDYWRRRRAGAVNPIVDFLFEYYEFRPGHLRRWSPGVGVLLEDAACGDPCLTTKALRGVAQPSPGVIVDTDALPTGRRRGFQWTLRLLEATASREPHLACFGMHEWAMCYQTAAVRHRQLPLRLGAAGTDRVAESLPIRCTHYDAFRFFTPAARPLNRLQPSAEQMAQFEQPGCLHANMDCYRWAFKGYPWVGADLVGDCLALALRAREIDMRASPYDLREFDLDPICIETPEGRELYQQAQLTIHAEAQPLRARLIAEYQRILATPQPP